MRVSSAGSMMSCKFAHWTTLATPWSPSQRPMQGSSATLMNTTSLQPPAEKRTTAGCMMPCLRLRYRPSEASKPARHTTTTTLPPFTQKTISSLVMVFSGMCAVAPAQSTGLISCLRARPVVFTLGAMRSSLTKRFGTSAREDCCFRVLPCTTATSISLPSMTSCMLSDTLSMTGRRRRSRRTTGSRWWIRQPTSTSTHSRQTAPSSTLLSIRKIGMSP
mmetsp:Transcript_383/g.882  ORF Transcript_383/g.882 Transcript_383/m.882 type:complete len:219 (+) Transcript_383:1055-1711(+)